MKRVYYPTVAQLLDRLSIVTLKSIKIHENKKEYEKEAHEIMSDLDLVCKKKDQAFFCTLTCPSIFCFITLIFCTRTI